VNHDELRTAAVQKDTGATVDRGRLIVLLYEGAISFLTKAKASIADNDVPGCCNLINRAQDIIDELNASLNMDQGGDIAANLEKALPVHGRSAGAGQDQRHR
jgi:flagellar biosynthetic protein FliS